MRCRYALVSMPVFSFRASMRRIILRTNLRWIQSALVNIFVDTICDQAKNWASRELDWKQIGFEMNKSTGAQQIRAIEAHEQRPIGHASLTEDEKIILSWGHEAR